MQFICTTELEELLKSPICDDSLKSNLGFDVLLYFCRSWFNLFVTFLFCVGQSGGGRELRKMHITITNPLYRRKIVVPFSSDPTCKRKNINYENQR